MNRFYLIINGSRTFTDYEFFRDKCNYYLQNYLKFDMINYRYNPNIEIISGCARGPDEMAIIYAAYNNIKVKRFQANWNEQGKKAGILRNIEMKDYVKDKPKNGLLSFYDGKSKGTSHMIKICKESNINIKVINIKGN